MKNRVIDAKPVKVTVIPKWDGSNKVSIREKEEKVFFYVKMGILAFFLIWIAWVFIKSNFG